MALFRTAGFVLVAGLVLATASACSLSGNSRTLAPTKPNSIAGDAAALRRKIERAQANMRVDHLPPRTGNRLFEEWKPLEPNELDYDAIKYRVSLEFPADALVGPSSGLKPQRFDGQVQLTLKPLKGPMQLLALDSSKLDIKSVRLLNTFETLRYVVQANKLLIDLNRAYSPSDTLTLLIDYHWEKEPNSGVYFRSRDGVDGIETIYSQSESEEAKYWFPGNARPNDRSLFESYITVPEPFVALSNGALVDTTASKPGYRTYHWSLATPVVSYLFVVTAGKFGVHEDRWRDIGVQYYGPADDMERLTYSLRKTPDMLEFLSNTIGLDYPYEKYAQSVVPQYQWGGMEHVTATTLTDRTVHSPAEEPEITSEGLVSHEMAHQWFGDLVTCQSWDHIWLNEGFATYFGTLWVEHSEGHGALLSALEDGAAWYFEEEDKDAHPVVFPYFRMSLDDYFDSRAYPKGAYVLHMLRGLLGDETFFRGIRTYIYRRQGTVSTTADLKQAMQEVSGRDLSWFFEQWLFKPGYPKFETSWKYDPSSREVSLRVKQIQDTTKPGGLAGTVPYFKGPVKVELAGLAAQVELTGLAEESFQLHSEYAPGFVKFNSENGMLAKVEMNQPFEAWKAQLEGSLDVAARVEAASHLAIVPEISTDIEAEQLARTGVLSRCAAGDHVPRVRSACLDGLATLANPETPASEAVRAAIFGATSVLARESDPLVLGSVAMLLAQFPPKQALPPLKDLIQKGKSLQAAVDAIKAVGKLKGTSDAYDLLVSLLGRESFQNRIREAALEALGTLADPRALDLGLEYASSRYDQGVRAGAFQLLARLGKGDPALSETARLALEAALADRGYPIRLAAVSALGELGNRKAIEALTRVMLNDPEGNVRTAARAALEALG